MRGLVAAVLGADVALKEAFRMSRMVLATGLGVYAAACCMVAIMAQKYVAEIEDGEQACPARSNSRSPSSAPSTRNAAAAA